MLGLGEIGYTALSHAPQTCNGNGDPDILLGGHCAIQKAFWTLKWLYLEEENVMY